MTPVGVKLWYADASVRRFTLPELVTLWPTAPSSGVQAMAVYFSETYQRWIQDGYNHKGKPVNHRCATENYRVILFNNRVGVVDLTTGELTRGPIASADTYWFDRAGSNVGCGPIAPMGLQIGAIKVGTLIADDLFRAIVGPAVNDRVF
jgi:hypothetical protein